MDPMPRLSPAQLAGHIRLLPINAGLWSKYPSCLSPTVRHPTLLGRIRSRAPSSSKMTKCLALARPNAGRYPDVAYTVGYGSHEGHVAMYV